MGVNPATAILSVLSTVRVKYGRVSASAGQALSDSVAIPALLTSTASLTMDAKPASVTRLDPFHSNATILMVSVAVEITSKAGVATVVKRTNSTEKQDVETVRLATILYKKLSINTELN